MKKRLLAILLTSAILLSTAACQTEDEPSSTASTGSSTQTGSSNASEDNASANGVNPAGVFPITTELTTFSAMMVQRPTVSPLDENLATEWIEENLNIAFDFEMIAETAWTERQNLALSTGSYPELIMSGKLSNADILRYGVDAQIFVPLNDAIDEYGDEIKKVWEEQEYLQQDMTAPDGNIYALPHVQGGIESEFVHRKMWLNEAWAEAVGYTEHPETTEELKDMLTKFKNDDPNGNGVADEIPMTGATGTWAGEPHWFLMNSFIPAEPYNNFSFVDDNGVLTFSPAQDAWKEGLMYIADLYENGLLDPAAFTNTQAQMATLARNPEIEIVGSYAGGHLTMGVDGPSATVESDPLQRSLHWSGLSLPAGPDGFREVPLKSTERKDAWLFAVTDKCENVEAAVRLADWLWSEEGTLITNKSYLYEGAVVEAGPDDLNRFGEPAKYVERTKDELVAAGYDPLPDVNPYTWAGSSTRNDSLSSLSMWASSQDRYAPTGYNLWLYDEYMEHSKPFVNEDRVEIPPAWVSLEDSETFSAIQGPLFSFVEAAAVEFITGARDFDNWDDYLAELDNMQYPEWFEIYERSITI